MKIDIFNTDKKYNIIYADPPLKVPPYEKIVQEMEKILKESKKM